MLHCNQEYMFCSHEWRCENVIITWIGLNCHLRLAVEVLVKFVISVDWIWKCVANFIRVSTQMDLAFNRDQFCMNWALLAGQALNHSRNEGYLKSAASYSSHTTLTIESYSSVFSSPNSLVASYNERSCSWGWCGVGDGMGGYYGKDRIT